MLGQLLGVIGLLGFFAYFSHHSRVVYSRVGHRLSYCFLKGITLIHISIQKPKQYPGEYFDFGPKTHYTFESEK